MDLAIPLGPRLTASHPRIESARGCVAIERGPLVYSLEQADLADGNVADVCLDTESPLNATWRPDLLKGVVTVDARGWLRDVSDREGATFHAVEGATYDKWSEIALTAIPYYAWANRAPGAMQVWLWAEHTHV